MNIAYQQDRGTSKVETYKFLYTCKNIINLDNLKNESLHKKIWFTIFYYFFEKNYTVLVVPFIFELSDEFKLPLLKVNILKIISNCRDLSFIHRRKIF